MNKAFLISLSALLGSGVLASGCGSADKPFTIEYQKPAASSGDTAVNPSDKTNVAGETPSGSGDEVITPTGDTSGISDYGSTTSPAPVDEPTVETPPSTPPTVVEGDGVADDMPPQIGTAPLPAPVSCDEKAFSYVSKRAGVPNVFSVRQGATTRVTANDSGFISYANLNVRPGARAFSADETALLVLIPIVRTVFGSSSEVMREATLPGDGFTRGFAWNHDGTRAAYLRATPDRGRLSTAIHYVTNLDTLETQRDMVIDPLGAYHVGQLAWWGNNIVYDMTVGSDKTIGLVDPERFPAYFQAIYLESSAPLTFDTPKLHGEQPAVSRGGTLAFVQAQADGRNAIVTCDLHDVSAMGSTFRQCTGLHVFNAAGNNDSPAFSPDGRWIYFVSDRDGNKEIYRVRSDGTGEERLTNDPAEDTSPAPFSPNDGCE